MSRLIESILLDIPIPPLYFIELKDHLLEVVDGQQRLTTIINFVSGKFKLEKLRKLANLNGKYFKDLDDSSQRKIHQFTLISFVVKAGNNDDLRYEIFERLNRGAVALKPQEIRNCVYRGPFCDLLAVLEKSKEWRKVKGGDKPGTNFIEREMILRFFAFNYRLSEYRGILRKFLNEFMALYAKEADRIEEFKKTFTITMKNVYEVFSEDSGRLYSVQDGVEAGKWETKFSISALDIQASALAGHSTKQVKATAGAIKEAYKFYLITNPQIRDAISSQPAGTNATKTRWFGFKAIVQQIINNPKVVGEPTDPLFQSRILLICEHHLPAGNAARVVLEGHLKKLLSKHNVSGFEKLTINSLNGETKKNGIYDQSEFLTVQWMAEIGNRSSHSDPKAASIEEVAKLIEEVSKFIKRYPI
jgi:hypothetical protein